MQDEYWIHESSDVDYYDDTKTSGKWLVFVRAEEIDYWWETIKQLLHQGKLGKVIKSATAKENPNARTSKQKVIVVYSYDGRDEKDVMRIRESLREAGITWKIPYKLELQTAFPDPEYLKVVLSSVGINMDIKKGRSIYYV